MNSFTVRDFPELPKIMLIKTSFSVITAISRTVCGFALISAVHSYGVQSWFSMLHNCRNGIRKLFPVQRYCTLETRSINNFTIQLANWNLDEISPKSFSSNSIRNFRSYRGIEVRVFLMEICNLFAMWCDLPDFRCCMLFPTAKLNTHLHAKWYSNSFCDWRFLLVMMNGEEMSAWE